MSQDAMKGQTKMTHMTDCHCAGFHKISNVFP